MLQKISAQPVKLTLAALLAMWLLGISYGAANADNKNPATPASIARQNNSAPSRAKTAPATKPDVAKTSAPATLTAEQRGEKVFRKAYCIGCHAGGNNALMPDKPIKGKAFGEKHKDDLVLERTIRKGFPDEGMPAFGKDQIPESQMKDLILYIRSFTPTK